MRRAAALLAVLGVLGVLAAACSDDAAPDAAPPSTTVAAVTTTVATAATTLDATPTSVAAPPTPTTLSPEPVASRPYEVEQLTATWVDESRITPATAQTEEQPNRTIDVWIDAPVTAEPRPLVIFAHGITGHPRSHEMLRTHLASEGFVVVAPAFPLTNTDVPGGIANAGDTEQQVADVSFLIDTALADPDLGPRIDPERIGMIGHSLGGLTTAGAALSTTGDRRIDAAVVMSAGFGHARDDVAVAVVHGDGDAVVPYVSSTTSYELLTGRRMLITLLGGNHIIGILDDDSELGVTLRGLVAGFFAHELGVDEGQVAWFDALPLAGVSIEAGTADGPLDDWIDYFSG